MQKNIKETLANECRKTGTANGINGVNARQNLQNGKPRICGPCARRAWGSSTSPIQGISWELLTSSSRAPSPLPPPTSGHTSLPSLPYNGHENGHEIFKFLHENDSKFYFVTSLFSECFPVRVFNFFCESQGKMKWYQTDHY
jgi:hypothetical protein